VKKIQVFLSPFIFTYDIYYEIITPNILIVFSLSFPYLKLNLELVMALYVHVLTTIIFMKLSLIIWVCYVKRKGWLCNIRNLGWTLLSLILDESCIYVLA